MFNLLMRKSVELNFQNMSIIKMDQEEDFGLMSIRDILNREKIKLWLPPYYEEDKDNEESLSTLADNLVGRVNMPKEKIVGYLRSLQEKSMGNLKEKELFQKSGVASLKIRAPRREDKAANLKIALSLDGSALKAMISQNYDIPLNKLKLISQGQLIKDDETLEKQGIKHNSQIMTLIIANGPEDMEEFESNNAVLTKTKRDVQYLAGRNNAEGDLYLQVADQSGKQLKLPKRERKALVMAMALHEKGRSALKNENFALALLLLLEAEQEFKQCDSTLLGQVDNYGLLSLDLSWCYLNLRSISQLPNAELRLRECENAFHKSYGSNMERLVALKGTSGSEAGLFLRLHLLQAIVTYHKGKLDEARILFDKVEAELKDLKVDDDQLKQLTDQGYRIQDARIALRQSKGSMDLAITFVEKKKKERLELRKKDKQEREMNRLQTKLGKCKDGHFVDIQQHTLLVSMGYSFDTAKWALAETNNRIEDAVTLIQEQPERLPSGAVSSEAIEQVRALGFDADMAKAALRKHGGNIHLAIEELTSRNGFIDDAAKYLADDAPPTTSKKVKTTKELLMEEKALNRVADGITNDVDEYLDLSLKAEEEILKQYKAYIADAYKK